MARLSGIFLDRRLNLGCAWVVWLLFAASFLMPVVHDVVGWQAYWGYLGEQLDVVAFWQQVRGDPSITLTFIFTWTNGSMFLAPAVLWLWPRWSGWLGFLLLLGGLTPCILFYDMIVKHGLRSGFYCWVGSIFLMAGLGFWSWFGYRRRPSSG